ncbi:MAG: MurR/RpiR family transcriptional regulator [Oscillospiraceae bacterium]|jgi:DNA-binding MurR/RpiR family transcriptional regulator|nr:MurR/RpiR family transcriptional regulator [Oscillospiraceae bacterium]
MSDEKDILTALADGMNTFSNGQKRIAGYIIEEYDKAAFITAGRLADVSGVSESTVVRFAQELGYRGYPEMRGALQSVVRGKLTSLQRIHIAREILESGDIPGKVLQSDIEQIRETLADLNAADFDAVVSKIAGAKNIYIIGRRSSGALAHFMGFYFSLLLPNVRVVSEASYLEVLEELLRITTEDVLVAISFPRYSNRTIRAMRYARDRGASVIAVTDSAESPVAKQSDVALFARSDMLSFVDTLTAPMSLVTALIVAVSAKSSVDVYANFEQLESVWKEYGVYDKPDV